MTKEQLGQVVLSSERQMYATAKKIVQNDQDCADAIQEAIVKAFTKIDTIKKDKYVKTWLMRILINECYNIKRRDVGREAFDEQYVESIPAADTEMDYSGLYMGLEKLKDELRVPTVMYYFEDFSVREIAQILDISEGAVQKRLDRARRKLRDVIKFEEVFS